jgi:hypothetical protein
MEVDVTFFGTSTKEVHATFFWSNTLESDGEHITNAVVHIYLG